MSRSCPERSTRRGKRTRNLTSLRARSAFLVYCFVIGCASQDSTLEVGTNTSWLEPCEETAECEGAGACRCGVCTATCTSDAECSPGICGSRLATNGQCAGITTQRLCLPAPEVDAAATCTAFPIAADDDLKVTEPTCAMPDALLCESFDAKLPEEYSTWYGDEEVASIQDCQVARGAGALRLQSSTFGYSQTRMLLSAPATEGPLFVRFFGYFAQEFRIPEYMGLFELWTTESGPPKIGVDAIGNDQLEVNLSPFSSVLVSAEGVLRRDEWLCIELALDLRTEGGAVTLSIGGTPVIEEDDVITSPGQPFSVAVLEAAPAPDSTGVDIAFDELVIATTPIGCE